MNAPRFWQTRGVLSTLLRPIGAIYGYITWKLLHKKGYRSLLPVICVGNATLGGTGKTPVVLALFKLLQSMGKNPVILTRGYKGEIKTPTLVAHHSAKEVGDEAKMMSMQARVIVSPQRAKGAKLAESLGFDVILMDDGLQNTQLDKDFSFLVHDSEAKTNGYCFPAGNYRLPLDKQLAFVQAVILTGLESVETVLPQFEIQAFAHCRLPKETPLLAFCGIGRPQKFFDTLKDLGFEQVEKVSFEDHHLYTQKEVVELETKAKGRVLITTQKDAVKWPRPIETVLFQLQFKQEEALKRLLLPILNDRLI